MQQLLGRLLVFLAWKFKIPIFVVYYLLWVIVGIIYTIIVGLDEAIREMPFALIFIVPLFWIIFPLVWHFTTKGQFWRTPSDETKNELFQPKV